MCESPVADPGFPVGGAPTRWGDTNLRHVHFSVKMYAKMKEIDPVGGGAGGWLRQWKLTSNTLFISSFSPLVYSRPQ